MSPPLTTVTGRSTETSRWDDVMTDRNIDQNSVATPTLGGSASDRLLTVAPTDPGWNVYSEGWAPPYGTSADFETDASEDVEKAEAGDGHVACIPPHLVPLAFIDGTRRAELLVWAEHAESGTRVPGLAGAYAVGAVTVRPGGPAAFAGIRVGRLAIWGGGHTGDIISRRTGYSWASTPITDSDPDMCLAHLQDRMRRAEGELALDAAAAGWNVVLDGPLNRIRALHGLVAGYVKSHHRRILPERAHAAVPSLAIGERTRMYRAGSDRYTCYMRVGNPGPGASPWSGIARLEFPSSAGILAVADRASALASILPAYAGVHHRDDRAPVNLTPVKNLERRLGQTLGRVSYAARAARDAVISGASQ